MEQRKCYFCGKMLEPGTGKLYIKKDGSTYYRQNPVEESIRIELAVYSNY